ncbi:hypothetical protein [Streptomyces sp. NPDC096132]|uniref:hypothetical protein n=1 Tax=Streptomyces sp. NPDC096132 TaxID=3366075 RepID=UPI00381F77C6
MKRNIKIATAVTAGVLAIGGVLAVGPATAGTGGAASVAARTTAQSVPTDAQHQARHQGGPTDGIRQYDATCNGAAPAERGTLTAAQKAAARAPARLSSLCFSSRVQAAWSRPTTSPC